MLSEREELEKLYANTFTGLEEGSIVKGKVIQIRDDSVFVDVGYKYEGLVSMDEFSGEEKASLKEGEPLYVYIQKIHLHDGIVYLSKKKAEMAKKWAIIEEAFNNGTPVEGKPIEAVKGGLMVDLMGLKAFLPGSHIDLKATKSMEALVGEVLPLKILKLNKKRGNIIVSRRVILEEQREQQRISTLSELTEGAVCRGVVKNLTDYGAFVDLGGTDGLLHISDMSWGRINYPKEMFNVGDVIDVMILKFDKENEKITLGYKQKKQDPWLDAEERYIPGSIVKGKVINIADYGVFVEIEEGVEGLIHVTEMDWLEKIRRPSKLFNVGDTIEAVVLNLVKEERKISLSIKQLKPNPWEIVGRKYQIGQKIKGVVRSFTDFGAFITIEEGIDALLHISDVSWTRHIRHPSEILRKGQTIEAVILNIEPEKERMALGLKQLTPDLWLEEVPSKYKKGDTVKGKIVKIAEFGLFISFNGGDIEGLVYASEIDKDPSAPLEELYKIGDEISATIIKVDSTERKIGLSMKTPPESK
jgi:small subunit ribosomal protein S1